MNQTDSLACVFKEASRAVNLEPMQWTEALKGVNAAQTVRPLMMLISWQLVWFCLLPQTKTRGAVATMIMPVLCTAYSIL